MEIHLKILAIKKRLKTFELTTRKLILLIRYYSFLNFRTDRLIK
ncbi:hypothetical protein LEP1GSC034_2624 [Leptospira interrogans str. 2003000735]|uniref:Uncharacterized protein n=8 Tax=Leptospira interrogans TaxID=173 RepID=M3H8P6_LEPIR|nr:hypothetical protein G436_2407 [Leptospira interrogans serovar Hardjo str. Norma]EJO79304.1 hypothetical protein LEP1GSC045_3652 [Leptospira interrogans serovar Pomona str. Kennewicki LC82-25]EJP13989.1 hypothetical protein LEP1GSC080_1552 [Leptospira interrogans str. FPW2026]EKN88558.1 hypothetical protein LEP1GSC027_0911 [Leptospira interrogans str. 2002000624]EKN95650.1 hypothetical protein LEP1GSC014_1600 [Leptospira interrogans serovar Pomona str. Pomona]EKO08145.1 hypothetical protein